MTMNDFVLAAMAQIDKQIDEAIEKFASANGRYPRFVWVRYPRIPGKLSYTITVSDDNPPPMSRWEGSVFYSGALNEMAIDE